MPLALLLEVFVPSTGNFYAQDYLAGGLTLGGVVGGAVLFLHGMQLQFESPEPGGPSGRGQGFMTAGAVTFVAARLYGLVNAGLATSGYNRELKRKLGLPPSFSATVAPVPTSTGLAYVSTLGLRF